MSRTDTVYCAIFWHGFLGARDYKGAPDGAFVFFGSDELRIRYMNQSMEIFGGPSEAVTPDQAARFGFTDEPKCFFCGEPVSKHERHCEPI